MTAGWSGQDRFIYTHDDVLRMLDDQHLNSKEFDRTGNMGFAIRSASN